MPEIKPKPLPTVRDVAELPSPGFDPEKFRPLRDQVLLRLVSEGRVTAGGLIIPDTVDQHKRAPSRRAVVVAVGPGARDRRDEHIPHGLEPGMAVLVGPDPGWELPDGHRVLGAGAVVGVVEEVADA